MRAHSALEKLTHCQKQLLALKAQHSEALALLEEQDEMLNECVSPLPDLELLARFVANEQKTIIAQWLERIGYKHLAIVVRKAGNPDPTQLIPLWHAQLLKKHRSP